MAEGIRRALRLLDRRSKRLLLILVVIQLALASLDLLGVFLLGAVVALAASLVSGQDSAGVLDAFERSGIQISNDVSAIASLAAVAGVVLIVKSVVGYLLMRRSYHFLGNRQALVSSQLASQLLSRPLLDVQRRSSQQTAYALTAGVNAATMGILGSSVIIAAETAVFVFLFSGLLFVDPFVAVFTVVFFGGVGLVLHGIVGNWVGRLGVRSSNAEIQSTISVQEVVKSYREVMVTGRRGYFVDRFRSLRREAASVQADLQITSQVSKYVFEVALVVGAGALAASQFLMRDLVAALSVIAVFLAAASRMLPALLRMQSAVLTVRSTSGLAVPLFELSDELRNTEATLTVAPEASARLLMGLSSGYEGFSAHLLIREATFTYPGASRPAIYDASVSVRRGESLALVGPTGAGKSTLADLILGVLQPDSGQIKLSAVLPHEATRQWPGAMSYVPQETAVLNGTIRSNVAFGIPTDVVDDDLVWDALGRAHLDLQSIGSSCGLETVVGENGARLSGGQRQRLGLARALFTQPQFILLDEATSALDAETEHAVTQTLRGLDGHVTLVIVAHRLATVRHCSQVAYVEDGLIQGLGSFEEVRLQHSRFDRQAGLLGL